MEVSVSHAKTQRNVIVCVRLFVCQIVCVCVCVRMCMCAHRSVSDCVCTHRSAKWLVSHVEDSERERKYSRKISRVRERDTTGIESEKEKGGADTILCGRQHSCA